MNEQTSLDILKLGPSSMLGSKWSHQGLVDINEITISHEPGVIFGLSIVYDGDNDDIIKEVGEVVKHVNYSRILFAPGEFLKRIYGHTSVTNTNVHGRLLSLGIETNIDSYGPFGAGFDEKITEATPYSWDIGPKLFRGFHGSVCSKTVAAIGVYVKKYNSKSVNIQKEKELPETSMPRHRRAILNLKPEFPASLLQ